MYDLVFSRQEIADLAQKLNVLEPDLTDQERRLLVAIFAAAADRAQPVGPSEATLPAADVGQTPDAGTGTGEQASLADLQQQLLSAYTPGNSFESITQGGSQYSIRKPQPPPPPH